MRQKQLEEVDGGVFRMTCNPVKTAEIIVKWINKDTPVQLVRDRVWNEINKSTKVK